jgi:hypothetical protein
LKTTDTGPTDAELREKEVQLFDGINGDRAANGFEVQRRNARRSYAVEACSTPRLCLQVSHFPAQLRNSYVHTGADGSTRQQRITDAGLPGPA